jgi:hypothetical protein
MLSTQTMKLYAKMTKLSHTLEGFLVEVGQQYQKQECLFPAYLKTHDGIHSYRHHAHLLCLCEVASQA